MASPLTSSVYAYSDINKKIYKLRNLIINKVGSNIKDMNDENEKVDMLFKKNPNSKKIKKDKFPVDLEAERRFAELKTKYANAIAFLLVKNVARRNLQEYFEQSEENKRRFETIKRIRQQIIDSRPKAKIWVDKPFYVKLDLGTPSGELEDLTVPIILGECVFKQPTKVVRSR